MEDSAASRSDMQLDSLPRPRARDPEDVPERGGWASKTEFLLSCLGYAIGLGNVWRFPYLCYRNGGGAFLVPYLLMLFLCGIPLFLMETTLGQFSSRGCVTVFAISPLFKGAGYAILVVNFVCSTYYSVILSYPLYFLAMCLRSELPWEDCDNPWNTQLCFKLGSVQSNASSQAMNMTRKMKTPADEFFHNKILQISDGIGNPGQIVWQLLVCDVVSWVVIFLCIMNSVRSVGKVVYFTATFPFVIILVLLARGLALPGAKEGVWFYLYPEWSQLANLKVWADAAIQIFYSLGPGWGGIINMASYNPFKNNLKRDSILVPILNCGTSILAGFVVFSVLGFMSHQTGVPISTVVTGGPGLAFVTYPEALSLLPYPQFWAILFYLMLFFLGIDSCFVQIEAIISSVTDEYPMLRRKKKLVTFTFCFIMFLGSLSCITNGGMYVLSLLDWYAASISVILICIVEVVMVGWLYGTKKFVRDLQLMTNEKLSFWWPLCWKYITPIILMFIFMTTILYNTPVTYNGMEYPTWALAVGWISAGASMIWIPIYVVYSLASTPGTFVQRLKLKLHHDDTWGPAATEDFIEWKKISKNDQ
ncbi:sodium- and chloride-dependent glycine transporter 1 [Bacillus rossius redtenbacheri]|uniref:sodium- and chloride-dependent glycine transporter 1 n=1 Tax=Bacillus rossius redtenbacheri TaxID=93214 RepID=UPI002FDE31CD